MKIDSRVLLELKQAFSQFPGFQLEENLESSRSFLSNPHLERFLDFC